MRRVLALLPLLCLSVLGNAHARTLADPIEGTWKNSAGGAVAVSATSTTHFVGKVTVRWESGNGCPHAVGQSVWEIDKKSDGTYSGINHGFANGPPACADQKQNTTWSVSGSTLQACAAGYACGTLTRPAPPPAMFADYRFSFTVTREPARREPLGPLYVRTDARGTGSFETGQPAANGNQVVGNGKGGVAVINRYVHESHFIAMNIVHNQGYYRRGVLVLRTVITRSDENGCAPGKTGMLKLVHSSRGDAIELDVCSFTLVFASAERSHVSVTITAA